MASSINYRAPNLISICIDEQREYDLTGRIYSRYGKKPIEFNGTNGMLCSIEDFHEELKYPQASTVLRSFMRRTDMRSKNTNEQPEYDDEILEQKGKLNTFIVQVQYRQNATWQGSVVWAEKNVTKSFRSALELIKLIDSAMEAEE